MLMFMELKWDHVGELSVTQLHHRTHEGGKTADKALKLSEMICTPSVAHPLYVWKSLLSICWGWPGLGSGVYTALAFMGKRT